MQRRTLPNLSGLKCVPFNSPPPPSSPFDDDNNNGFDGGNGGFGGGNGGFGGGNGGFGGGNGGFGGGNGGFGGGDNNQPEPPPQNPPRTTPLDDIINPAFAFPAPFWSYDDNPGIFSSRLMTPPGLQLQAVAFNFLKDILDRDSQNLSGWFAVSDETEDAYRARITELRAFLEVINPLSQPNKLDSRVLLMLINSMYELQLPNVALLPRYARTVEDTIQTLKDLAMFGNLVYQPNENGGNWNQSVDPALLGASRFNPPPPPQGPPGPPPGNFTWPPPPPQGPPAGFPDLFPR